MSEFSSLYVARVFAGLLFIQFFFKKPTSKYVCEPLSYIDFDLMIEAINKLLFMIGLGFIVYFVIKKIIKLRNNYNNEEFEEIKNDSIWCEELNKLDQILKSESQKQEILEKKSIGRGLHCIIAENAENLKSKFIEKFCNNNPKISEKKRTLTNAERLLNECNLLINDLESKKARIVYQE